MHFLNSIEVWRHNTDHSVNWHLKEKMLLKKQISLTDS